MRRKEIYGWLLVLLLAFLCAYLSKAQVLNHVKSDTVFNIVCGTVEPEIPDEITIPEGFKMSQVVTIPVVFHVVWNTSAQNLPDQRLLDQLDALNRDFRLQNFDTTQIPAAFKPLAADFEVEFCLATLDPNGNVTTGITRTQTSVTSFTTNAIKFDAQGGKDIWDRNNYLNIWVGNLGGGLGGWAQFPCQTAATDGIVVQYWTVGNNLGGNYNLGRVAVHEVGHWLGIFHTFQGGCASNDFCADTPPTGQANFGCPAFPFYDACTSTYPGVMFMNYMDYTYDWCHMMFTHDQKLRALNTLTGCRNSLLSSPSCTPVNSPPPTITSQNATNICAGEYSQFTSTQSGTWTTTGGTLFSSTNNPTQIQFLVPGTFWVKLTNSNGSDSVQVTVNNCPKVQSVYTNWKMGKGAAVTFFTAGAKIAGDSKLQGIEACSGISDAFGNFLFSTDFRNLWDENGVIVTTGLIGSPNSGGMVSATAGLVLPSLTQVNIYYIFTISDMGVNNHGLVWYVYNSQTKQISGQYYANTNFPICEGVSATRHCYGNGWIIAGKGKAHANPVFNWDGTDVSDKLITWYFQDGLNYVMNITPSFDVNSYGYGQMKFSPSGNQLAVGETSTGLVELYDFDREFGIPTYNKSFQFFSSTSQGTGYGLEFSPNENFLYTDGGFSLVAIKYVLQWDINTGTSQILGVLPGFAGQLQLGPDNKIYVTSYGQNSIGVINSPDLAGLACNFVNNQLYAFFPSTRFTTYGLPNNVHLNSSVGWCLGVPLPIELLSFDGSNKGDYNLLTWVIGSEKNNSHFILEKSTDALNWFELTWVDGAGNSQFANHYSFKDYLIHAYHTYYYRLAQVDFDGTKTTHPKIIAIHSEGEKEEVIYNVFGQKMSTPFNELPAGIYIIQQGNKFKKEVIIK